MADPLLQRKHLKNSLISGVIKLIQATDRHMMIVLEDANLRLSTSIIGQISTFLIQGQKKSKTRLCACMKRARPQPLYHWISWIRITLFRHLSLTSNQGHLLQLQDLPHQVLLQIQQTQDLWVHLTSKDPALILSSRFSALSRPREYLSRLVPPQKTSLYISETQSTTLILTTITVLLSRLQHVSNSQNLTLTISWSTSTKQARMSSVIIWHQTRSKRSSSSPKTKIPCARAEHSGLSLQRICWSSAFRKPQLNS